MSTAVPLQPGIDDPPHLLRLRVRRVGDQPPGVLEFCAGDNETPIDFESCERDEATDLRCPLGRRVDGKLVMQEGAEMVPSRALNR